MFDSIIIAAHDLLNQHFKINKERTMEKGKLGVLKIKTKEELEIKIKNYFNNCDDEGRPYTVSGLALFLGISRVTLNEYSKNEEKPFSYTVKAAKVKIESQLEEKLIGLFGKDDPKPMCSGLIFNLKNNFGWKDESKVHNSFDGQPPTINVQLVPKTKKEDKKK